MLCESVIDSVSTSTCSSTSLNCGVNDSAFVSISSIDVSSSAHVNPVYLYNEAVTVVVTVAVIV